jgi:calcium-translocating P-type ATPase
MNHKITTPSPTSNWHALNIADIFSQLETSSAGLSNEEALSRQKIYGTNEFVAIKPVSRLKRFLRQFNNILIYILLISGTVALFLKHWVDASVIVGVVLINALFGYLQEGKAEHALEAIRKILATMSNVLREGKRQSIFARELVPGDIVFLQSGDKIPADIRIITSYDLQAQEAALTGESFPVSKSPEKVAAESPLAERFTMVYCGTHVTYGRGSGVVVATGNNTEVGKISSSLAIEPEITTPLLKQINRFGRWLTLGILLLAAATFLVGFIAWHDSVTALFMAIVGIVVAAIPEGLPAIITIILAIGVTEMAKRHAIVRRLPAVETMGAVTVICTDKTGTLTRNELVVDTLVTAKNSYAISGNGYVAIEAFNLNGEKITSFAEHPDLVSSLRAAVLCNDTVLTKGAEKNQWYLQGDPLDGALWTLGLKAKIDIDLIQKSFPRTDLIPFESQHQFMATLHHDHLGNGFIFVKGAPEKILKICSTQSVDGRNEAVNSDYWLKQIDKLTKEGHRVIACAFTTTTNLHRELKFSDFASGFTLLSLFALIDPPRHESKASVEKCHAAGISVKMITGDHAATASYIAAQVGIKNPEKVITGKEIDNLGLEELREVVQEVNVYARTSPEHKLRLVNALKENNNIVAMTGDGVNDAPALKQADIGIAMGQKGTDTAKEAAAIVLTDDDFATIAEAVEAGRTIYDNLKKAILYILPTSIAQCFAIVIAIIFGQVLPITPVQILWVNMITAVALSLAFAFEPTEEQVMQRPPRPVNEPIMSGFLAWRTIFVSVLITAAAFIIFWSEEVVSSVDLATLRTAVVNMIVAGEIVYLFNCRKIYNASWNLKTIFGSRPALVGIAVVVVLQLLFTYVPFMQLFFGTANLDWTHWLYIGGLAIAIFLIVEIEKKVMRRLKISVCKNINHTK